MTKTPVVIAAYNEAEHIGATLRSLDPDTVEPFVVVNGELGASETVAEARRYTSRVYVRDEQGKFPALQFALRKIGNNNPDAFGQPILFTDADTTIVRAAFWARHMSCMVAGDVPRASSGPVLYRDGPIPYRLASGARRLLAARGEGYSINTVFGANLALNFASSQDVTERILDAPHIWPGEDRFMVHTIAEGNALRYTPTAHIGAAVLTSARYLGSLRESLGKISKPVGERVETAIGTYGQRRAPSAKFYFSADLKVVPYPDSTGVPVPTTPPLVA